MLLDPEVHGPVSVVLDKRHLHSEAILSFPLPTALYFLHTLYKLGKLTPPVYR